MKPEIGDVWLITIPVLTYNENNEIGVLLQKRPCLIVDDGRGLIVEEDNRNYHVLKLTTQSDPYKRKLIENWREIGLLKKSYVRIEMPIKIEIQQLDKKITTLPPKQLIEMYEEIYKIINIEGLEKLIRNTRNKIKESVE